MTCDSPSKSFVSHYSGLSVPQWVRWVFSAVCYFSEGCMKSWELRFGVRARSEASEAREI